MWTNMSNSSVNPSHWSCLIYRDSFVAYTTYLLGQLLLLPLLVLVLYVALQRRRSATTSTANGHMDVLTNHMVLLELLGMVASCLYYYGSITRKGQKWSIVISTFSFIGVGQSLFHLLACLDRYTAVVHPIRYVWTRQSTGIRLRNICIGCAWLLCLPSCLIGYNVRQIYTFILLFSSVLFSSGTLCVLIAVSRSGPIGESGAKRRAMRTVAAITMTLVLRFVSSLVPTVLLVTLKLNLSEACFMVITSLPFSLPSSLVMPLLFLQRVGKVSNCQNTSRSGRNESG